MWYNIVLLAKKERDRLEVACAAAEANDGYVKPESDSTDYLDYLDLLMNPHTFK